MSGWRDWWPMAAIIGLMALLVVAAIHWDSDDRAKWGVFAAQHRCTVTGRQEGYWIGKLYMGPRLTWRCDNGVNYTRDE